MHRRLCREEYFKNMRIKMKSTPEQMEDREKWKVDIKARFDGLQEDMREAGFRKGDTVNLMLQTRKELTTRVRYNFRYIW